MAESPSGHQFIVTKSPDREERYKIVQTRVHDRVHALEEVSEQLNEYKGQENVVLNVMEENKATIGEAKSYGVELEKIKADFGRINVRFIHLIFVYLEKNWNSSSTYSYYVVLV